MPDALDGVESLGLVVTSAVVKVTSEGVGLAMSLRCDVRRAADGDVRSAAPTNGNGKLPPRGAGARAEDTSTQHHHPSPAR